MREIPFVDAHVHLWDLENIHYPWLTPPFSDDGPNGSVEPIARNYLLDDYLDDAAEWNVVGIVHVDAGADAKAALDETQWLQTMASERGMPQGIVAFAALDDPNVEPLLDAHAAHRNVRGIRHIVNWHRNPARTYTPRDVTRDEAWQRGFALLGKYGLSFDLQCYPGQLAGLTDLIARHPEIPVVINHIGMPVDLEPEERSLWMDGMRGLAAHSHVAVKISGLGFVYRSWTLDLIRPYVLDTIEMFGTDRAMFASDFPTDKLFGSFDGIMGAYESITADFTEDERRALFGRNAARIYRLDLDV